jgi:hypothetical protein
MKPPQGEERRRKKERKKERKRGGAALFYAKVTPGWLARLLHKSCQLTWCNFIDVAQHPPTWHDGHVPVPWVTLVHIVWLLYESCQSDWHDSRGAELRNKCQPSSFLNFFKNAKIKKSPWEASSTGRSGIIVANNYKSKGRLKQEVLNRCRTLFRSIRSLFHKSFCTDPHEAFQSSTVWNSSNWFYKNRDDSAIQTAPKSALHDTFSCTILPCLTTSK